MIGSSVARFAKAFANPVRESAPVEVTPQYALCERVTASPTSPQHIRLLPTGEVFPSGGADGPALCGAKVAWDTRRVLLADVPRIIANQTPTNHLCTLCVTVASQASATS